MITTNALLTGMNCSTWSNGKIDYTSDSETFIWANRVGSALDTTSKTANLVQHQNNGQDFKLNLVQATGGSASADANPFSTTTGAATVPASSGTPPYEPPYPISTNILIAHGTIMALVVVLLFPFGALLIRVAPIPWWVHAGLQATFMLLFTAGWGLGFYWADNTDQLYRGDAYTHNVLGTVLFAFFWIQPILGLAHHLIHKRKGHRTAVSHAHIWWGRIILILAIVNGGLGLQLSDNTIGGEIAYGVVAGIVFIVYVAGAVYGEMKRKKNHVMIGAGEK